jgi:hypothetical protein
MGDRELVMGVSESKGLREEGLSELNRLSILEERKAGLGLHG